MAKKFTPEENNATRRRQVEARRAEQRRAEEAAGNKQLDTLKNRRVSTAGESETSRTRMVSDRAIEAERARRAAKTAQQTSLSNGSAPTGTATPLVQQKSRGGNSSRSIPIIQRVRNGRRIGSPGIQGNIPVARPRPSPPQEVARNGGQAPSAPQGPQGPQSPTELRQDPSELSPEMFEDGKLYKSPDGTVTRWDDQAKQQTQMTWDAQSRTWAVATEQPDPIGDAVEMDNARYSAKQQREMEEINNAVQAVRGRDDWSQEQKDEAIAKLDAKYLGITQSSKGQQQEPEWPKEQGVGKTWNDKSGALLTRDSNGDVRMLVKPEPPPKPEASDKQESISRSDYSKMYMKTYEDMTVEQKDGSKTYPTMKDVQQRISDIMSGHQTLSGTSSDSGKSGVVGPGGEKMSDIQYTANARGMTVDQVIVLIARKHGMMVSQVRKQYGLEP